MTISLLVRARSFAPSLRTWSSLLRFLEILQIRRRLVLLGRHQLAVGAEIIRLAADLDPGIVLRASVRVPGRTGIRIAGGLLDLDVWPRHCMIDHGDLVDERVAVGLVEIDPL